jgi:uncharacterized protein with PIN domain
MPSEKAKENKTLAAPCKACGRVLSTELLQGVILEAEGRRRTILSVCDECRAKGWRPPSHAG